MHTRRQKMAQRAATALRERRPGEAYASYAKSLPALIHAAGLCQAVAFLQAKCPEVLADVIRTIGDSSDVDSFADLCRTVEVPGYVHLTRMTLDGSTWIKRYVEVREKEIEAESDPPRLSESSGVHR